MATSAYSVSGLSSTAPPPRILCFGDSLTAGTSPPHLELFPYATSLQATLGANVATVRHKGYPGWTAAELLESANGEGGLRTLIRRVQDPPLSLVILLVGTNDLAYYPSETTRIFQSIQSLHELCHGEEGVPHTLAIGIPPSQYQTMNQLDATTARQVNQRLEEYCQNSSSTTTFVKFPFDWAHDSDLWSEDGLHFSPRGYQVLGESLAPIVKTTLQQLGY